MENNIKAAGGCTQMQTILRNQAMAAKAKAAHKDEVIYNYALVASSELMDIKGIGRKSAERLMARWIDTKEKLLNLTEEQVAEITGNPLTAKWLMNAVKAYAG